jgi:hypothetical protein
MILQRCITEVEGCVLARLFVFCCWLCHGSCVHPQRSAAGQTPRRNPVLLSRSNDRSWMVLDLIWYRRRSGFSTLLDFWPSSDLVASDRPRPRDMEPTSQPVGEILGRPTWRRRREKVQLGLCTLDDLPHRAHRRSRRWALCLESQRFSLNKRKLKRRPVARRLAEDHSGKSYTPYDLP